MFRMLRFLGVVLLLAFPIAALADADVVTMTNGDHLTGRVVKLERGQLEVSAEKGGSIDIPWNNVATITSTQRFEIELASGRRYYGPIKAAAGHLDVEGSPAPITLEMKDVIRITPVVHGARARTTGSLEAGFSLVNPPDVTTSYTLDGELAYRGEGFTAEADLDSLSSRNQGDLTESRNFFQFDARKLLASRWFTRGLLEMQNDKDLNLDFRFLVGGGIGRTLAQSHESIFAAFGGLDYNHERYSAPQSINNSAEVSAGLDWDWFPAHSTEVVTKGETFISLQRPRARLEFSSQLTEFVFRKLFWGLKVFESFDSNPPGDTHENSNFGTDITLGWRF
jgi:hypothetical protein